MTSISSLFLATSLVILPVAAFAQQTAAPTGQNATQVTKTDAKASGIKTPVATKDTHAKLGTTTPAAPAKTAEPGKS
jgi:hypothetical protein